MNDTPTQPTESEEIFKSVHAVLHLLSRYYDYTFYSPFAREMLTSQEREHKGKKFTFNIADDGNIEIVLKESGTRIVYSNLVITVPPSAPTTLDNVDFKVKIVNKDNIPFNEIEWAEEISVWVSSFFQRTVAATFFARMHPEVLNQISAQLTLMAQELGKQQEQAAAEKKE